MQFISHIVVAAALAVPALTFSPAVAADAFFHDAPKHKPVRHQLVRKCDRGCKKPKIKVCDDLVVKDRHGSDIVTVCYRPKF